MSPVKSIKLSIICGAVLGASIVCSTAFAQTVTGTPTPGPPPGSTVVPHPHACPYHRQSFAAAGRLAGRGGHTHPGA
jgi:hypothetical protein